jgi:hypothetical protein
VTIVVRLADKDRTGGDERDDDCRFLLENAALLDAEYDVPHLRRTTAELCIDKEGVANEGATDA